MIFPAKPSAGRLKRASLLCWRSPCYADPASLFRDPASLFLNNREHRAHILDIGQEYLKKIRRKLSETAEKGKSTLFSLFPPDNRERTGPAAIPKWVVNHLDILPISPQEGGQRHAGGLPLRKKGGVHD